MSDALTLPGFKVAALLVAAGRGARVKSIGLPKQFRPVGGLPLLSRTLDRFLSHPLITDVLCVIHPDDKDHYRDAAERCAHGNKLRAPVPGGATRQESVFEGLKALSDSDLVLIHDGVRPFVSEGEIASLVDVLRVD
ncbi:MAG: 2-C-methyl-D-erythritol 4-phosphate cytidylyltransferase, partial [Hyphomicrobiaceae bacterium]|nr:2-C-methyl-D-erythritol 4-phosphate cytidylyltransferase [Hyphomicrobiaceae bacterium]